MKQEGHTRFECVRADVQSLCLSLSHDHQLTAIRLKQICTERAVIHEKRIFSVEYYRWDTSSTKKPLRKLENPVAFLKTSSVV